MKEATLKQIILAVTTFESVQKEILIANAAEAYLTGEMKAAKILGVRLGFSQASSSALDFLTQYRSDLITRGGSTIQGEFVPWLKDSNEETRKTIMDIIEQGIREGKPTGVIQAQRGTYPSGTIAADLKEFFDQRKSQASTVARTEVARIQNQGILARYKEDGVEEVDVLDGEGCAPCSQANGQRWTVAYAQAHELEHPNCVRGFSPVVK